MITRSKRNEIENLIHNYRIGEKVTRNDILTLCETISPSSPKTGRPITFGTYCVYKTGEQFKALGKDTIIWLLNDILESESTLGFFN